MNEELRTAFIKAAIWEGSLEEANQLLDTHPDLAAYDIHTAAITGDAEMVRRFLEEDRANATAVSAPYGGNALVHLCLSKYLLHYKERSADFLQAAKALLDAGADSSTGFWVNGDIRWHETPLYGAAGVAHDAALTRLLLSYGAEPNDIEAVYHSPETYDNDALKALVETGELTKENLSIMLIRKLDWHDYAGLQYMLEHGADPNGERNRGWYSLYHSLRRVNGLEYIQLLLDHGADPLLVSEGFNAVTAAACEGRGDVLKLFSQRGILITLEGVYQLIAACALGDTEKVKAIVYESPALLQQFQFMGGELLARFCLCGNAAGVRELLHIGIPVNAPYRHGDGYYGIPPGSLAIHVAAWRGYPAVVQLLIEAGALVDVPDKNGQTPLALAVKACVDSYWTQRRSPDSVKALLGAGASTKTISFPCGYDEVDVLLSAGRGDFVTG